MPNPPNKFYLTTPIYYVNARPHIGHAYSTIAADVIARRHRLFGDDTFFLTGTDEHGQKVQRASLAAGVSPQAYADQVSASFQNLWKRMGITNDDYIRTTDERHKRGVQHLWKVLEHNGAIYLDSYTGAYCVSDEAFVDLPAGTPCPDCGRPLEIVTEENYFFKLSEYQDKLIHLIESGELHIQPETTKNEVLSFVRGNVAEAISAAISEGRTRPVAADEVISNPLVEAGVIKLSAAGNPYVPGALKDLSISRTTFDWGIPVPGNPKHVIYVWLDALANYITAVGYGSDDPADKAKFAKYWPADLHLVGKEITRFHCVYWPAFLMAAGIPLPKAVVANGWLLFEESKMSKSRGNVVRTETILDAFGDEVYGKQFPESTKAERDLFAADVLRYFLLREIPFGQDGSFSFDALITRYNADLANGYGNLVSRTLKQVEQKFSGQVISEDRRNWGERLWLEHAYSKDNLGHVNVLPRLAVSRDNLCNINVSSGIPVSLQGTMTAVITHCLRCIDLASLIDREVFAEFLGEVQLAIRMTDAYLTIKAPWKIPYSAEEGTRSEAVEVLYTAAEAIRIITALLYPVVPYATASVWRQLGLGSIEEAARNGELRNLQWGGLKPGTKLGPLAPIFPRADKGLAQIMTDMENPTTPAAAEPASKSSEPTAEALNAVNPATAPTAPTTEAAPAISPAATDNSQLRTENSPLITIDDFVKIDLRVAQIVVAERIPKADKLLRLEVDLGPGFDPPRRQILAGIAEYYAPETLIGRKVVIVANLAPRKMRGLESQGMIVAAAVGPNGAPVLAGFLEDVELGSRLK